jgi:hypothetical protein
VIIHYDTPAVGAPTATLWSGMTFSSNRHPALPFCLSIIFSESRYTLFRIMRQGFGEANEDCA